MPEKPKEADYEIMTGLVVGIIVGTIIFLPLNAVGAGPYSATAIYAVTIVASMLWAWAIHEFIRNCVIRLADMWQRKHRLIRR